MAVGTPPARTARALGNQNSCRFHVGELGHEKLDWCWELGGVLENWPQLLPATGDLLWTSDLIPVDPALFSTGGVLQLWSDPRLLLRQARPGATRSPCGTRRARGTSTGRYWKNWFLCGAPFASTNQPRKADRGAVTEALCPDRKGSRRLWHRRGRILCKRGAALAPAPLPHHHAPQSPRLSSVLPTSSLGEGASWQPPSPSVIRPVCLVDHWICTNLHPSSNSSDSASYPVVRHGRKQSNRTPRFFWTNWMCRKRVGNLSISLAL